MVVNNRGGCSLLGCPSSFDCGNGKLVDRWDIENRRRRGFFLRSADDSAACMVSPSSNFLDADDADYTD